MLKPSVVGAAVYTDAPATAGAGKGNTGARETVHTKSLVQQMPPVKALITLTADDG